MTKNEALKMAIEFIHKTQFESGGNYYVNRDKTIKACKEALEQPAQDPVGWMNSEGRFRLDFKTEIVRSISAVNKEIPLYTHPAPSPWQGNKEFVGLSNDRIREIGDNCLENNNGLFNWIDFARAIEQALKEKNNAV